LREIAISKFELAPERPGKSSRLSDFGCPDTTRLVLRNDRIPAFQALLSTRDPVRFCQLISSLATRSGSPLLVARGRESGHSLRTTCRVSLSVSLLVTRGQKRKNAASSAYGRPTGVRTRWKIRAIVHVSSTYHPRGLRRRFIHEASADVGEAPRRAAHVPCVNQHE